MTDETRDIFDDETPAPQTTEGISPEAPAAATRDESGRFAAKGTGDTASIAEGAPPAPVAEKSRDVPITALLDEREKRQRFESEVAQLRRQLAGMQQPQKLPDPVEDAEGYTRHITMTFEQQRTADRLAMSQFLAEDKYGKELVDEAMSFFDNQPHHVSAQFLSERSPFHAAIAWYQRHREAEERSSPEYEAKLRAKLRAEWEAEQAQHSPTPSRPNVPRSLAAAPGSGFTPSSAGGDPLFD